MVVLHVARAGVPAFRFGCLFAMPTLELRQDRLIGHVDDVRQHVEPPPVRHADDRLARAVRRGELEREIEHRYRHVESFDRKPLLAQIRLVQEPLERFDGGETGEQLALALGGQRPAMLA